MIEVDDAAIAAHFDQGRVDNSVGSRPKVDPALTRRRCHRQQPHG